LFGGSFDPPHLGHLALARCARDALVLDEVRWIPAGAPWQKAARALAEAKHRSAMVALLVAGEPGFVLDERELRRQGPCYTIDTVRELLAERPGAQLFLIIGQDQYAGFHTWHEWRGLAGALTLAVAARGDEPLQPSPQLQAAGHVMQRLPMARVQISATDIRARLKAGRDIESLVGEDVARYIDRHHLYRSA
jgi:nicotinate-nucleotide adenylyltransferase